MSSRFPARPYTLRRMAARRVGETQMSFGDTGKDADAMTVSELIERMNGILKGGIPDAWVSGEIADLRRPGSGHLYFSLKDERAAIACVMWRSTVVRLPFEAEEGLLVLARGYPDVYEPSGKLSLVVGDLQPSGIGALQLAFEQLKARLQAEGLFDVARKRPLPLLPRRIGVVTSRHGAALHDILKVLGARFPDAHVTIYPASVQGAAAPGEIVRARDLRRGARGGCDAGGSRGGPARRDAVPGGGARRRPPRRLRAAARSGGEEPERDSEKEEPGGTLATASVRSGVRRFCVARRDAGKRDASRAAQPSGLAEAAPRAFRRKNFPQIGR